MKNNILTTLTTLTLLNILHPATLTLAHNPPLEMKTNKSTPDSTAAKQAFNEAIQLRLHLET